MKKKIILLSLVVILSGCSQSPQATNINNGQAETVKQDSSLSFSSLLPQVPSNIRGINVANETYLTLDEMEIGLMNIASEYIDDSYLYDPGKVLTSEDASDFLEHEYSETQYNELLKNNEELRNIGLNPIITEDPITKHNNVTTLLEQDYFKQNADGTRVIDYITIGVGVDTTNEIINTNGEKEIVAKDKIQFLDYDGKIIANKITNIIKKKPGYENIEIIYAFYEQSENPILPGTFIAKGKVAGDENTLEKLEPINEEYIPFLDSIGSEKDNELNNNILQMKNNIISYFGQNVGFSAIGFYRDDKILDLDIKISTINSSILEGSIMVDFVQNEIDKTLNTSSNVFLEIKSSMGTPIATIKKENRIINKIIY